MGFFTVFHIFSYVLPGTRSLHLTPPSRCLLMLGLKDGDGFFVAPAVLESRTEIQTPRAKKKQFIRRRSYSNMQWQLAT